jgi:hypothetical protein
MGQALAREREQELVLAVAGHPGDAEDLAGLDLEGDVAQIDAVEVLRRQVETLDHEARVAEAAAFAPGDGLQLLADHQLRHGLGGLDVGVALRHHLGSHSATTLPPRRIVA